MARQTVHVTPGGETFHYQRDCSQLTSVRNRGAEVKAIRAEVRPRGHGAPDTIDHLFRRPDGAWPLRLQRRGCFNCR